MDRNCYVPRLIQCEHVRLQFKGGWQPFGRNIIYLINLCRKNSWACFLSLFALKSFCLLDTPSLLTYCLCNQPFLPIYFFNLVNQDELAASCLSLTLKILQQIPWFYCWAMKSFFDSNFSMLVSSQQQFP